MTSNTGTRRARSHTQLTLGRGHRPGIGHSSHRSSHALLVILLVNGANGRASLSDKHGRFFGREPPRNGRRAHLIRQRSVVQVHLGTTPTAPSQADFHGCHSPCRADLCD
jgi:hypothetical protein